MEEQFVATTEISVQDVLLQMLKERAARAVKNALRRAGCAGCKQDEQRMVKRVAGPFAATRWEFRSAIDGN